MGIKRDRESLKKLEQRRRLAAELLPGRRPSRFMCDPAILPVVGLTIQWQYALPMLPIGIVAYYVAWKLLVGFLNLKIVIG